MTKTHLGLDEKEGGKEFIKCAEERREGGGGRGTHAGEEREGGARLWGEPHACAWQWLHHEASPAHIRGLMMVARLWKKYAARRTVKALSAGSYPKILKNLTAWRWERM